LIGVSDRLAPAQIALTIKTEKDEMPGFPNLTEDQMFALVDYLMIGESKELARLRTAATGHEISLHRISQILDPEDIPPSLLLGAP